jgi:hypothetical protein
VQRLGLGQSSARWLGFAPALPADHTKLRQQRIAVEFTRTDRLTVLLRLRGVCSLLGSKGLLKVLPNGLVLRLCGLLTRLERCQLRFAAKLACGYALQEVLLLGGIALLRRLQCLLEVLRLGLVCDLLGLGLRLKPG